MTTFGACVWLIFFGLIFFFGGLVAGLLEAAGRPTPDPYSLIADYSAKGTACENCVDLDRCTICPHDWVDFGVESTECDDWEV